MAGIGLVFLGFVSLLIGLVLRSCPDKIVHTFGTVFFSAAASLTGIGIIFFAASRLPVDDTTNGWLPVLFFGILVTVVGMGMPFKPSRRTGRP